MSGFIRGKIECYIANKDFNFNLQNGFKNLYDFFTSHPNYTLIALNYGATNGPASSAAGTGTGYADPNNSNGPNFPTFGNNAWFVVRANATTIRPYDVFHYFQLGTEVNATRGLAYNQAPANPSLINGQTVVAGSNNNGGLGYACAIGISGSGGPIGGNTITGPNITGFGGSTSGSLGAGFGNPWRGSMNALTGTLGIDQKANGGSNGLTGVWGQPPGSGSYASGSGVMIFPRSNDGSNGSHQWSSTLGHFAENTMCIFEAGTNNNDWRMHIIGDDDSFVIYIDVGDQNTNNSLTYSGLYLPMNFQASGSQSLITPYVVLADGIDALPWNANNESTWGDAAGTQNKQGGIIGNTSASVKPVVLDYPNVFFSDTNFQPNNQISSSVGSYGGNPPTQPGAVIGGAFFDELQIPVGIFETTPAQVSGYLGEIDFVRWVFNVPIPGIRWDFSRVWIGNPTNNFRLSVPWDNIGRTVPRTGWTRQGITFVRPPLTAYGVVA